MRGAAFVLLLLAAIGLAPAARAQEGAQPGAQGVYVTEMMEMASMLDLGADGRFRWMLSYGALDMSAEGRWREEGGAVLLDTEPPVAPPRFEFLGAGREGADGLVVRIKDEAGQTPQYLNVEASYDSGDPGHAVLDGDAYRFPPAPGRRLVSIRVGSGVFRFWSEPYPVPAGADQMRFRFHPGDLGRGDFRGTRATLDGQALLLPVLGEPLRYRRLSAAETAELRAALAEMEAGLAMDMSPNAEGAIGDVPPPPLSDEETANDLACMNEGLRRPRGEAIAACTALLASTNLIPAALAVVRTNRGNLLTDDGELDRALADYEEALRLDPEYAMAYLGRSGIYERRGDFARAAADSREAVRREPENSVLLNSLCWQLALAGEALDEARNACDSSLTILPDDPDTLDSRGLVGLKQARFAEAWADFDAAVRHGGESHPNRASFLYGRGIAALWLGRTAEGQRDLADAAARDPAIAATYARRGVRP